MDKAWQLQEAKNKLSEVIDRAIQKGPQTITRHGKPEAVILSVRDFRKIAFSQKPLLQFFSDSPLKGIEIDLARSKDLGRPIKL